MSRREFGDWQTPLELARSALAAADTDPLAPATVLEPTCGEGAFLVAAAERHPAARLVGWDLSRAHAAVARARLPRERARIRVGNFFALDWEHEVASLAEPILVTGNPPWVTSSALGALGSDNLPDKSNFKKLSGYDALTGKSNFDVSEWMILRLLQALRGKRARLALLCKSQVARRVLELAASRQWDVQPGALFRVDAMRHFRAAVDAVLFVCEIGAPPREARWPIYDVFDAVVPSSWLGVVDGVAIADLARLAATRHLEGRCEPEWRSGLKHDCSRVMELERAGTGFVNGFGERVELEDEIVFPLLKSSDLAGGAARPRRHVVVPQRTLGEDTSQLRARAPRAFAYLSSHRERLGARKSSIYRGQPEFAIFGVGPYAFAPWKVAISGFYKRCEFSLVAPDCGRPVMLDDTCYFLPFSTREEAERARAALSTRQADDFIRARVFWDDKRPIRKSVLERLDWRALAAQPSY